jgi:hypothetical protein
MPSSWSPSLRFELQFPGENINLWGDKLDVVLQHVDTAIAGWLTKALTASPYTLTTANVADDEARAAMLKFTGGAGPWTVQIPALSKAYSVWNATSGPVTLTTGSGATVTIDPGDIVAVICDGTNVRTPGYGGLSIKDYIAAAVIGATGSLPATTGNAGKFIFTDGSSSYWKTAQTTDLGDYATKIVGVQVALAVAL